MSLKSNDLSPVYLFIFIRSLLSLNHWQKVHLLFQCNTKLLSRERSVYYAGWYRLWFVLGQQEGIITKGTSIFYPI